MPSGPPAAPDNGMVFFRVPGSAGLGACPCHPCTGKVQHLVLGKHLWLRPEAMPREQGSGGLAKRKCAYAWVQSPCVSCPDSCPFDLAQGGFCAGMTESWRGSLPVSCGAKGFANVLFRVLRSPDGVCAGHCILCVCRPHIVSMHLANPGSGFIIEAFRVFWTCRQG